MDRFYGQPRVAAAFSRLRLLWQLYISTVFWPVYGALNLDQMLPTDNRRYDP
jgi:hypothetical protein